MFLRLLLKQFLSFLLAWIFSIYLYLFFSLFRIENAVLNFVAYIVFFNEWDDISQSMLKFEAFGFGLRFSEWNKIFN